MTTPPARPSERTTSAGAEARSNVTLLRAGRAGALALAIAAFLAVAVLALTAESGRAVVRPGAADAAGPVAPAPTTIPPAGTPTVPVSTARATTTIAAPAPPRHSVRAPDPVAAMPVPPPDRPPDPEPLGPVACPLGLPPPSRTGGLASLVPLVPAFGPYSAEAFAMAPAYEPLIELFGPFVWVFGEALATHEETLAPAIAALRDLEDAGFERLDPLYGPYRPEVLASLASLADTLTPYTEQLAASPAAACLIALEGMVASAGDE